MRMYHLFNFEDEGRLVTCRAAAVIVSRVFPRLCVILVREIKNSSFVGDVVFAWHFGLACYWHFWSMFFETRDTKEGKSLDTAFFFL